MITRTTDAKRMNEIFNDPGVHPWVAGFHRGVVDVSEKLQSGHFIGLLGDHGCFLVQKLQLGIYDFHTAVLPYYRGSWASDFFKAGLDWMFINTDAVELMTKCPVNNPASKMACRRTNFDYLFETRPLWPDDDKLLPFEIYGMTIQKWATFSGGLPYLGIWFHERLEAEYARLGKELKFHDEDAMHNRYVGGTVAMMMGQQVGKAVSFYNRWALMSDYQPISVVSLDPLVIDIAESRLCVTGKDFKVI